MCLLWGNVWLGLLFLFRLGCLFFWYWAVWAACVFWKLIICQLISLKLFSPILSVSFFNLVYCLLYRGKALKFNKSHLFTFVFISIISRRRVIENLALIYVIKCSAMFSSKSFIVFDLTFRSLIHFEFIVYDVRKCSNFILLHVAVQFSQDHLLKRLYLPHCIFLSSLSKIRYP